MKRKLKSVLVLFFLYTYGNVLGEPTTTKHKSLSHKISHRVKTKVSTAAPEEVIDNITIPAIYQTPNIVQVPKKIPVFKKKNPADFISFKSLKSWAEEISTQLLHVENQTVPKDRILKGFKEMKRETRDGAVIVEKAAKDLDELLDRRAEAAAAISREAERLAKEAGNVPPPTNYIFDNSIDLDVLKKIPSEPKKDEELPNNCSSVRSVRLKSFSHFGKDAKVELDISSVKVAWEVFDCDKRVLPHIYWSEDLIHTFRKNYAQDAMTDFQYFCSAKGFLRHYPATSWKSMFKLNPPSESNGDDDDDDDGGPADIYDCRLRPWYVAAGGAPRDFVILFDFSGSMVNSSNKVKADIFTLALLTALTDDDHVNVLAFYDHRVESVISCLDDTLVPANYVNTAAMMTMLKEHTIENVTEIPFALREATKLLNRERKKRKFCQQAIVLISDSINENYTQIMRDLDPFGNIRLFVIWLHDIRGLRDKSHTFSEWLACSSDGYYGELVTASDVTEQVMRILRVMERPLVHQRKETITVFSDVYAHVEDPRRSELQWINKENEEQAYRYAELRKNKKKFLSEEQRYKDYTRHTQLNTHGYYYEGNDLDFRLQISVSVPVFDDARTENITIILAEEKQRKATRTYPVNRLLGVAGVDIPIEHLKLILPYYQLGAGGSLFLLDHRGNIVLHENHKPVFDGDILRPGYRTIDLLDLEQPAQPHEVRKYPNDWIEFRNNVVADKADGKMELYAKYIYDHGLRAMLEKREYHWRRVNEHYTVVVTLPKYNKRHAVPEGKFTQSLAEVCNNITSEISIHPEWLYCKHVDQRFDNPEDELRHFFNRRMHEDDFKMQNLRHIFSPLPHTLWEKTYMCNEELIVRMCKEAIATQYFTNDSAECVGCSLGSVTAFFAGESGLTRWQEISMLTYPTPRGSVWSRGPEESWYKRAVASPGLLIIHAPVTPFRHRKNSFKPPPELTDREIWLTAARTLGHPEKGTVGVAGYHFHPQHLETFLNATTYCGDEDCDPSCDGENWVCVLIDEGGWIVAGDKRDKEKLTGADPVRDHLARAYPRAMKALLDSGVFQLHWIHDYQAICFPPQKEYVKKSAGKIIPALFSGIHTFWRTIGVFLHVAREVIIVIGLISTGALVTGDTDLEKEKRVRRIWKDWQREKFDQLWDPAVMINRTHFAACDRSRALYVMQRTPKMMELLKRPQDNCTRPVSGVEVPQTNLVLLAIDIRCPPYDESTAKRIPDPLVNESVNMTVPMWEYMTSAARLACWRNRTGLRIRAPNTTCFPHNYADEEGYRQCGPWLPDEDQGEDDSSNQTAHYVTNPYAIIITVFSWKLVGLCMSWH